MQKISDSKGFKLLILFLLNMSLAPPGVPCTLALPMVDKESCTNNPTEFEAMLLFGSFLIFCAVFDAFTSSAAASLEASLVVTSFMGDIDIDIKIS